MEPSTPVAVTKFELPPAPPGVLVRSSLLSRISSSEARLVLMTAPAGWGKTTLLRQVCEENSKTGTVACVALDRWDDDPARFWQTVVASLASIGLAADVQVPAAPSVTGRGLGAALVPAIINELAACNDPVSIVLDDYHQITDETIHEAVAYLVGRLPHRHRLFVSARHDPPLPLARLRAGNDLVEIRAADLALTGRQIVDVSAAAGVNLSSDDAALLHSKTEGWPAAVYLCAISLQGRTDISAAITEFHGDQRHVADYLTGEVLARMPDALRQFMLQCSILDRLDPDLCASVTGEPNAKTLLREIEARNLFLVPLEGRSGEYRFNRLFADWLRHRLLMEAPHRIPEIHRRAMEWFLSHDMPVDAIEHAIAAGQVEQARLLLLHHGADVIARGQASTFARWLAALPDNVVTADPVLSIAAASTMATGGDPDRAEQYLDAAEESLAAGAQVDVPLALEVEIAAGRATIAMVRRDLAGAVVLARRAAALETDPTRERYGIGHAILGGALFWTAEPAEARAVVDRVWSDVETTFVKLLIAGVLSASCLETGAIDRAESVARFAVQLAAERHTGPTPEMSLTRLALGGALAVMGETEEAETEIGAGIEQSKWWKVPGQVAYGNLLLAQLRIDQGNRLAAEDLIRRAAPIVDSARTRGVLAAAMLRTQEALRRGGSSRRLDGLYVVLTTRERDVLRLLSSPLTQREIGRELGMTVNTVKSHTQSLYRKLGVACRDDAVARARGLRLS